jgi:hypothetical protein
LAEAAAAAAAAAAASVSAGDGVETVEPEGPFFSSTAGFAPPAAEAAAVAVAVAFMRKSASSALSI